ncbi:uncharacterized protein B0H64DRAFT_435481 [Chaetomium fimeti]|uniref:BZIP domain-containing protein n=1 Tax=Chaetomium fimeti TaxID=1854472 RepID=A0AAE0LP07_9PEZI|nr:hypothetical protein B0H64DRAFT_435481 [Chaetomium fimeti]
MDYESNNDQPWRNPFPPLHVDTGTNKRDLVSDDAHEPSPPEDVWTSEMDRKTKKRIQNRVAQRTYRSRMRQRVQDLQREIYEMRTGRQLLGEQHHQFSEPPSGFGALDGNGGSAYWNAPPGPKSQLSIRGVQTAKDAGPTSTHPDHHVASNAYDMGTEFWMSIPGDPLWNGADPRRGKQPFPPSPLSSSDTVSDGTQLQPTPVTALSSGPRLSLTPTAPRTPTSQDTDPRQLLKASLGQERTDSIRSVTELSSPQSLFGPWSCSGSLLPVPPTTSDAVLPPQENEIGGVSSPRNAPAMQATGTATVSARSAPSTSAATPATDLSENGGKMPTPDAPVEERFSYVLDCARRVGFDWDFDALATQYYARDFESGSPLALEQRLSRNRRLPVLLAQLRQLSTTWNHWQRRGYQDETLKTAEEICARECRDFYEKRRQWEKGETTESQGEECGGESGTAMLEDHLPNLWAFLTGLAASNPLLEHSKPTAVASMCMELLCGEAPGRLRQGAA